MDLEIEIQKKIFEILSASTEITDIVSDRIYDLPPEDSAFPYVTIGDDRFEPWDTHDSVGFQGQLNINVWTQSEGRKKAKELNGIVYDLLHDKDLGIAGTCTINLKRGLATTKIDPDGITVQGISRFNIIIGAENGL